MTFERSRRRDMAEEVRSGADEFLFKRHIGFGFCGGLEKVERLYMLLDLILYIRPVERCSRHGLQVPHGLFMSLFQMGHERGRVRLQR